MAEDTRDSFEIGTILHNRDGLKRQWKIMGAFQLIPRKTHKFNN